MIRRERLRIVVTCDGCGQVRQDQEGQHAKWRPYPAAWKDAQDVGWSATKKSDGKDFDHHCPDCKIETGPATA